MFLTDLQILRAQFYEFTKEWNNKFLQTFLSFEVIDEVGVFCEVH